MRRAASNNKRPSRKLWLAGFSFGAAIAVRAAVAQVEQRSDKGFGDVDNPLLVSVRSGSKFSMPGMMDTVLDLGLNDESVRGLANHTDERFAFDSYRRFIQMYAKIVMDADGEEFDERWDGAVRFAGDGDRHGGRNGCLAEVDAVEADDQVPVGARAADRGGRGSRPVAFRNRSGCDRDR